MIFVSKEENYFILLSCTRICSTLSIVLHQAGVLLPTVDLRCTFIQDGGIIRLIRTWISNIN